MSTIAAQTAPALRRALSRARRRRRRGDGHDAAAHDLILDDFEGHEGCNEILNVTRPDVVASVHDAYFEVGVDCVETNTFGANLANLGEYDISDRIYELAEAGRRLAREAADAWSTPDRPRWVLGSVGPGHQAADAGPRRRSRRCATPTQEQVAGHDRRRRRRRPDRDRAGPAAGQGGDHRRQAGARPQAGGRPAADRQGHGRDDRHDAARHRDRRRADRARAARHRPDRPQLRHRSGRDERAPAPPVAARAGRRRLHAQRRPAAAHVTTARTTR